MSNQGQQPNLNQQFLQWIQNQTGSTPGNVQSPLPQVQSPSGPPNVMQQQKLKQQGITSPLASGGQPQQQSFNEAPYAQAMKSLLALRQQGQNVDNMIQGIETMRKQHMQKAQPAPNSNVTIEPPQNWFQNATQSAGRAIGGDWNQFVQAAKTIAAKSGFPLPVLLSQAAVESARGKSAPGNNYFGIKAVPGQASMNMPTQEATPSGQYYNTNANFAAYNSIPDAINAYIKLVMSYPGVAQAVASGNNNAVAQAIAKAGYATSPTYLHTIENTPEFRGGK